MGGWQQDPLAGAPRELSGETGREWIVGYRSGSVAMYLEAALQNFGGG